MKNCIILAFLSVSQGQQDFVNQVSDASYDQVLNDFGNLEEIVRQDEDFIEKVIHLQPSSNFHLDYRQQTQHLERLTTYLQDAHQFGMKNKIPGEALTCHSNRGGNDKDPSAEFMFLPAFTGNINPVNNTLSFEGNCFESVQMDMVYHANDATVQLVVKTEKPRNHTCSDVFIFGNTEIMHVEEFFFKGTHKLNFKLPSQIAEEDIDKIGLETFLFCEHFQEEIMSVITTLKAFIGGLGLHGQIPLFEPKVPEYMIQANIDFLSWGAHFNFEERKTQKVLIDEDLIQSGDYLAIMRLDGLDPLIMYGTGSHSGHSTMALRFDGELYIVESQDAWYWPVHRIQRNRFSEWIKMAETADFHVAIMPLSDEKRAQFNETAAQEFFFAHQGLPYGYHNFLMSWIDTSDDNLPLLLPKDLVGTAFAILEKLDKNTTDLFMTDSLNKHIGTEGLNLSQIALEANKQGLSFFDTVAMVEQDGWKYEGYYHDGEAYTCSCFVTAMWKAAGLFGDLEINAVEWTPKDVYQVDFFNKTWERPQDCVDADPDSQHCQLLGRFRMEFPGFSTLEPYSHMNDKCGSMPPTYVRPDGC